MNEIDKYQVKVLTKTKLVEVSGKGVVVENTADGAKREIAADAVVLALGVTPLKTLYDGLKGQMSNLYLLGDADHMGQIADAVSSAYSAAIELH